MNKKFLEILLNWPRPYITGVDLHFILNGSPDSRQSIIKRAIQQGYIASIKRDLFLIKNRRTHIDCFEIAPVVYGPSYVSFEAALSYHGWIPEAVRTTTCASVKRTKEFETPMGIFSYEHIPIKVFSFGVEQYQQKNGLTLFIASPLKALADFIYTRKRTWEKIGDLLEDLRIEPENLKKLNRELLTALIENYPSSRVKNMLQILFN